MRAVFIWCTHLWEMSVMLTKITQHAFLCLKLTHFSSIPAPGSHGGDSVLSRSSATQKVHTANGPWMKLPFKRQILLQILLVHDK